MLSGFSPGPGVAHDARIIATEPTAELPEVRDPTLKAAVKALGSRAIDRRTRTGKALEVSYFAILGVLLRTVPPIGGRCWG